jgi:hypothetical protein
MIDRLVSIEPPRFNEMAALLIPTFLLLKRSAGRAAVAH